MIRWLGFALIVSGAGAAGMFMAHDVKRQVEMLHELESVIHRIKRDMEYNLMPLPDIAAAVGRGNGRFRYLFQNFASLSREHSGIPCGVIMQKAFHDPKIQVSPFCVDLLLELFHVLGTQDLEGQLRAAQMSLQRLQTEQERLSRSRDKRMHDCRTISICAGLALAILLI